MNNASKVSADESQLQEEYILRRKFLNLAIDQDIQLLQLPCPEFILYGSNRWGHVKPQFDNPYFRKTCKDLFEPIVLQLKEYLSHPDLFSVLGIVSVEGSPSCGLNLTCTAQWGGEFELQKHLNPVQMINESGVFTEQMKLILHENSLSIPFCSLEEAVKQLSEK